LFRKAQNKKYELLNFKLEDLFNENIFENIKFNNKNNYFDLFKKFNQILEKEVLDIKINTRYNLSESKELFIKDYINSYNKFNSKNVYKYYSIEKFELSKKEYLCNKNEIVIARIENLFRKFLLKNLNISSDNGIIVYIKEFNQITQII
tara:strand:+ start:3376 stop:3822 length:447 start_codon:yes stop_codon:yes gene_type:complete